MISDQVISAARHAAKQLAAVRDRDYDERKDVLKQSCETFGVENAGESEDVAKLARAFVRHHVYVEELHGIPGVRALLEQLEG